MFTKVARQLDAIFLYRLRDSLDVWATAHFPVPWLVARPFLLEKGYRLKVKGDLGPCPQEDKGQLLYPSGPRNNCFLVRDHLPSLTPFLLTESNQSPRVYEAFESTGQTVFINRVPTSSAKSQELNNWRLLLTGDRLHDPRNHTVPVTHVLKFQPDFSSAGVSPAPDDECTFVVTKRFEPLLPKPWVPSMNASLVDTPEKVFELARQLVEVRFCT